MATLPVVVNEQDMRRSGQGGRVSQRAATDMHHLKNLFPASDAVARY
jgi:hypothetical protein